MSASLLCLDEDAAHVPRVAETDDRAISAGHRDAIAQAASNKAWVERKQADLLYAHLPGSLAMNMAAATLLALMVTTPACVQNLKLWVAAMAAVQAFRTIDLLVWRPARHARDGSVDGRMDIVVFAAGNLATTAVWTIFGPVFFPFIGGAERDAAAVVMALIAGGGSAVLAAYLPLAVVFCAMQVLAPSILFLSLPGRENSFMGMLGLVSFPLLLAFVRTSHHSLMLRVGLTRTNQLLVGVAEKRRRDGEAANRELAATQVALDEAKASLSRRILDRNAYLAREASDRDSYAEALARLATTDSLTGLANRAAFVEQLADMLTDAERAGHSVAVLFIDLDKFKQVNDVRGHETGDHVLRAAAALLSERVGSHAVIARWGGDEFVVAVPEANDAAALSLALTLRRAFATPIKAGLDMLRVDATIGVALYPKDAHTHDELIRAADVAMYEGKKEGGGRIKLFDPALAHDVAERHMLEQSLRDAIYNGDFSLVFQPIVSADTGHCQAFEALLRWAHPLRGPIPPAVFIPVAEQSGQIGAIGRWVLNAACRAAATWPGDAPPVTVNVSVEQVLSGTLPADVFEALAATGLPVHRLQLEITESLFATDQSRVTATIEALRAAGVRILMDDFGAGYSSLACLSSLPLDVIKIDKSFVQAAGRDSDAFIKAILLIARSLRLPVIAEGIETVEQRETMRALGVEMLQGYLFARPMAEDEIGKWLEEVRGNDDLLTWRASPKEGVLF